MTVSPASSRCLLLPPNTQVSARACHWRRPPTDQAAIHGEPATPSNPPSCSRPRRPLPGPPCAWQSTRHTYLQPRGLEPLLAINNPPQNTPHAPTSHKGLQILPRPPALEPGWRQARHHWLARRCRNKKIRPHTALYCRRSRRHHSRRGKLAPASRPLAPQPPHRQKECGAQAQPQRTERAGGRPPDCGVADEQHAGVPRRRPSLYAAPQLPQPAHCLRHRRAPPKNVGVGLQGNLQAGCNDCSGGGGS
jgi:hypothetical protein